MSSKSLKTGKCEWHPKDKDKNRSEAGRESKINRYNKFQTIKLLL